MRRWIPAVITSGFVMAGDIKQTGFLALLPFDLTLAFALLTAAAVGWRILTCGLPREAHAVILAFALLVPPVLWSAMTEYGDNKVGRLFSFTFLAVLAPVVIIRDSTDVRRHLWAFTGFCGVVVVTALIDPRLSSPYEGAPLDTQSVDTIGLGSAAGHVMVVIALGLIWKCVPRVAIVAAGAAVYVLLESGSRGPLFSAIGAVLVGSLLTRVRPDYRRVVAFLALLFAGLLVAYNAAPLYSQRRIVGLLEGDTSGSVDGRIRLYQDALGSILRHPFGIGWGGFEGITWGGYRYPHDMVLELLTEAGVVFGALFLGWVCLRVLRAHRITEDYTGAAVFAVMIFWLGEALVSGDINDNRVFLYALGIAIAAGQVLIVSTTVGATLTAASPQQFTDAGGPDLATPVHARMSKPEPLPPISAAPRPVINRP
jgi:hypothetical protein